MVFETYIGVIIISILSTLFLGYSLFVFLRRIIHKKKKMYKILVKFPNPERTEWQKYFGLMRGFFSQLTGILKHDRISLEIHKNGDFVEVLLLVSNKNHIKPLIASLTPLEASIQEVPESYEPLAIYEAVQPFIQRPYLEQEYTSLNLQERDFFRRVVDYLSSLEKNEYGGIVCLLQPSTEKKREIKLEIQKRDELAEYEVGNTNTNTEKQSLQQKIHSNDMFQVQFYCIGSDKHIATSLSSIFNVLNGENKFLIDRFFTGSWENIKKRYLPKPSLFSNLFNRKYIGSFLSTEELATIFTPVGLDIGRYKQQEITVLESSPEFLEPRANNIKIGESLLKTGKKTEIYFPLENLERHIYLAGKTGMGKSTLMIQLFLSILEKQPKKSLCLLDPHGSDLIEIAKRMENWDDWLYLHLS